MAAQTPAQIPGAELKMAEGVRRQANCMWTLESNAASEEAAAAADDDDADAAAVCCDARAEVHLQTKDVVNK